MATEKPTGNPEYDALPESIKAFCTPKEYLWLGAEGRARLVQESTESEYDEP